MRTRPFLSHKREDRRAVIALKQVLAVYGVGGWRDLDDLHLGELSQPGFEDAINNVTGGCIWYGTKRVLGSWYVNNVELPAVVARKRREPGYPLVPVFSTISPREARAALRRAATEPDAKLTKDDVAVFADGNGYVRERAQRTHQFHVEVARRYVVSAVSSLHQTSYSAAITALTEPSGTQDFTLDWRTLLDPRSRVVVDGAAEVIRDALTTFRDVVKPTAEFPHLILDLDLPLPLAAMVGYDWRVTSRLKLTIRQRTRSGITLVNGDGRTATTFAPWTETELRDTGPTVVAVATTAEGLACPLGAYVNQVCASRTLELHMPGELDAPSIRALARHTASALRASNAAGHETHLLLAGPAALAALVGTSANAAGPVTMPFWNGSAYVSPVVLGD